MNEFENLSTVYNPLDKYSAVAVTTGDALSMPAKVIHGAVATAVDLGTTYWNSLTPERFNADTADVLSRIDQNAMQVYNENRDTVQTLSFIGGMVAPVGLSMKLLSHARAGAKGVSYFSEAASASRLQKAEEAFKNAGPVNDAFIKAKWDIYRGIAANAVVDSAVAELAVLGALSAHPHMEDYTKDLGSNFLLWTAVGGAIGGTIGGIFAKSQIAKLTAPIEKEGISIMQKTISAPLDALGISEFSHIGEQIAVRARQVDDLKALLADSEQTVKLSPYTVSFLTEQATRRQADIYKILQASAGGEMEKFLAETSEEAAGFLLAFAKKAENAGMDKLDFAVVKDQALSKKGSGILSSVVELFKRETNADGKEVLQGTAAYWSPVFQRYFGKQDAVNYLTLADLGKSVEALEKEAKQINLSFARADAFIEREVRHSALVDEDYAKLAILAEGMDEKALSKLVVHPEDLAALKAIYVRAKDLGLEDLKLATARVLPEYKMQERLVLKRGGLATDYGERLRGLERDWGDFSVFNHGRPVVGAVSAEAELALAHWVGGHYDFLRNGSALLKGLIRRPSQVLKPEALSKMDAAQSFLEEISHSPQSRALRAKLGELADEKGFVWLYRGMSREPSGHMTVESYSILPEKAAEFGKGYDKAVKLYKVHVDDIIGTVRDFGPTGKRPEILAFPPTRDFYDIAQTNLKALPDELVLDGTREVLTAGSPITHLEGLAALKFQIEQATRTAVKEMSAAGYGLEAMALRVGTTVFDLERAMLTNTYDAGRLQKYLGRQSVEEALSVRNRGLAISTKLSKVPSAEMFANLSRLDAKLISQDIVEMYMLTSESSLVRDIGLRFRSDDIKTLSGLLYKALENYTPSALKSTFFSSANQVLSAMPEIAALATVIGKESTHMKNFVKETFEEPIARAMGAVLKDPAGLLEANTALNLLQSTSGFRVYKDGQFWKFAPGVSQKTIKELVQLDAADFRLAMRQPVKEGSDILTGSAVQYKDAYYAVTTPAVKELLETMQEYGRHMYELKNSYLRSVGRASLSDIGFWTPTVNMANKEIAYSVDMATQEITMLFAKNAEELNAGIAEYEKSLKQAGRDVKVIRKDMQAEWSTLSGRHDPMYMKNADLSLRRGGSSASAIVATDASVFQDLLSGYAGYITRGIDDVIELQLSSTMSHLKNLSEISQRGYTAQTSNVLKKLTNKPVDPGQILGNILLGRSNLSQHKTWAEWQQRGQVVSDIMLSGVSAAFAPILGKGLRSEAQWVQIEADMRTRGIINPFEDADKAFGMGRFLAEGGTNTQTMTPRAVSLFNGLASTVLLRFLELGQPLVNALSLPILTQGAVRRKMADSFLGAKLDPNATFTLAETMHDSIRLMHHLTEGEKWSKMGERRHLFKPELRDVTEVMSYARSLDPGVMRKAEDMMESSMVKLLSSASDWSEGLVRKVSYFNGVVMAKRAYPGLSDTGIDIFARNFMDEAVGNYTAAQRPAMFQGTFGTAMGLFQTYMLTMAQQIYRNVEHRDWAGIGKQMLTQSSIFGVSSLPGFSLVSEQIAKSFSDQRIDLETGLLMKAPTFAANAILYGLPSSFGPGITTRGDIQPRLPNPFEGVQSIAAVNITMQALQAGHRVAQAAFSVDKDAGRAMLEALSLQSVSRPFARLSELATGSALTGSGDVVASDAEIWNTQSVISRVFATRPLKEIKARQALHLNSVYGQYDSEKRKNVTKALKSAVRSGTLGQDELDELASEYMRTGTATGWRSAVNEALSQEVGVGSATVVRKLHPSSPLQAMIEDLD